MKSTLKTGRVQIPTQELGTLVCLKCKENSISLSSGSTENKGSETAVGGEILSPEEEAKNYLGSVLGPPRRQTRNRRGTGSCTMKSTLKTGRFQIPTQEFITRKINI
jgi:hypothetical protein